MNKTFFVGLLGVVCGVLVGFLGSGLILFLTRPPKGNAIILKPAPSPMIKVSIKGAVQYPGVYSLEEYSRYEDAIDAAGGFTENADLESLNLAAFVEDGMQIYVPNKKDQVKEEVTPKVVRTLASPSSSNPQKEKVPTALSVININSATVEELMLLPRIGKVTAQKIVQYREVYGSFRRIEDIQKVAGIGDSVFESIKPFITVQP